MANEVRIKVTADSGEAQKDLKRLGGRVQDTKASAGELNKGFGQLTKTLALLGVGTLGFAALIGGTIKIIQSVAKETAQLDFVFGLLPENLQRAFANMEPQFDRLADVFARTREDVALAFAILLRDTRRADITMEQLAGTLGFVAREGLDVTKAAELVAAALNGDISAIKSVTGFWKSLNEALRISALTGADAVTIFDLMSKEFRQTTRDLGRALDELSEGNFLALLDIMEIVGNQGGVMFFPGLQGIGDMIARIKDMGGEWDDLVTLLQGAGGAIVGVLDFITEGFGPPEEAAEGLGLVMGEVGKLTDDNKAFREYLDGLTLAFGEALTAAQRLRMELMTGLPTGLPLRLTIPQQFAAGRGFGPPEGGGGLPPVQTGTGEFSSFSQQAIAGGFDTLQQAVNAGQLVGQLPFDPDDFHTGGIVGGGRGRDRLIRAQAGEGVFTEGQMAAMGGGNVVNNFIVEGDFVVDSEARADKVARDIQEKLTQFNRGGQGT